MISKYPDGTSYSRIDTNKDNFIYRVNNYEDLWHLNQIVDAYNHNEIKPTIIIPNLIDAQADRRFEYNQSAGLKLVLDFIGKMNANFKVFHPHNSEVVENSTNNIEIIDNSDFIIEVLSYLGWSKYNFDNLILMSSDAGGFKPLMKLCDTIKWKGETVSASKYRSWDEVDGTKFVQQIDRQDFNGKDILIIDDISIYGGTFKGLSKLLRERKCGKLYLAVSHMTIQNLGKDPITRYFDKVFTTNSKYNKYYESSKTRVPLEIDSDKLQVIKMFSI